MPEKSTVLAWHTHTWYREKNLGSPATLVLVWHFQALLLPSGSAPPRQWGSGWSFLSFIFHHKDKDSRWGIDDFIKYRQKHKKALHKKYALMSHDTYSNTFCTWTVLSWDTLEPIFSIQSKSWKLSTSPKFKKEHQWTHKYVALSIFDW